MELHEVAEVFIETSPEAVNEDLAAGCVLLGISEATKGEWHFLLGNDKPPPPAPAAPGGGQ